MRIIHPSLRHYCTQWQRTEGNRAGFRLASGKLCESFIPLHPSQKIISENEEELVISVSVVPCYDFKQAILAFGDTVKVLSPKSFQNEVIKTISLVQQKYSIK